jgi:peptidoglycan-N-acetylglucosamine deacetylase
MNILSFDVEDWFQGFKSRGIPGWEKYGSREQKNIDKILELLEKFDCSATFFILGNFAEQNKDIVKQIHRSHHEVASHSYSHIPVPMLNPEKFREDLLKADDILSNIIGKKIIGYRAPKWSINNSCLWALDILAEEGYEYDSSLFPSSFHTYGNSNMKAMPNRISLKEGKSIFEFPAQILTFAKIKIPVGGGFYLRAAPEFITRYAIRKSQRINNYSMIYLHPYEFDSSVPKFKVGLKFKIIRYYKLEKTEEYLHNFLKDNKFFSCKDAIKMIA